MSMSRRLLPVFLGLLLLSFGRSACAAELLAHPDFAKSADGRVAEGWRDGSTALPRPADLAVVPEGENDRPAQRVILGPLRGGRFRLVQTVAVPAPGLYRLRARFRSSTSLQVELVLRAPLQQGVSYGDVRENLPAGQWRDVVGYARVPAPREDLDFVILVDDPGTVWMASASLQRVDEVALTPAELAQVENVLGPSLPSVDEVQITADTNARIQANRTAPLRVNVVDAGGRPLAGAIVRVEHLHHLFWFGAGFDWTLLPRSNETRVDRLHREAFLRLFNTATVRFDADSYEPRPGDYRDAGLRQSLDWLAAHDLRAGGHQLFWNLVAPRWLETARPTTAQARAWMDRLLAHASDTVLSRFDQVVVFNEVVAWDRYQTPLTPALAGEQKAAVITEYLRQFKTLNPRVTILINDYDPTPAYYHLLREVIAAGAPLDAIGLQTHMHNGVWSVTQLWNTLNRLALLKRPVFFTELSVVSGAARAFNWGPADPPWETTPEGEAAQADYLEKFYRLVYSHPAAEGITYWDYSDRGAWLGCPVGLLRRDGSPKPAYWRLDRLINQEWRTRGDFRVDAQGHVLLPHAYEGEYRLTANGVEIRGEHRANRPLEVVIRMAP
jgi:endo-1,4-beta-xylanase